MTGEGREWLASFCRALPYVRWDRMVEMPLEGDDVEVNVYGWIDRGDGRSDFVLLRALLPERALGYTTSSAELTCDIHERLFGHLDGVGGDHNDCQRVEVVLGDLVPNAIRL